MTQLRAFFVWSPTRWRARPARCSRPARRAIVPRSGWNADEKIRRATPSFAPALRLALVHHTAGANGYTAAESPAIVRAIELYHVQGERLERHRLQLPRRPLRHRSSRAATAGSSGTSSARTRRGSTPARSASRCWASTARSRSPQKARDALARLLAWRLDLAHVDPASTLSFISGGNARFPAGLPVFLRAVSGHRDTGFTDCPGTALYGLLDDLAGDVAELGLPKLYAPRVTGTVPGIVRFRARLSAVLPWTVDVYDAAGDAVASGSGFGADVDWSWDATLRAAGQLLVRDPRSDATSRRRSGAIGGSGGEPRSRSPGLAADPETVSPNADGVADETTITYTLTAPANVTVTRARRARRRGRDGREGVEAGGRARACASTRPPCRTGSTTIELERERDRRPPGDRVDAARRHAHARRRRARLAHAFSPNADGRADRIAFRFELAGAGRGAAADPQGREVGGDAVRRAARAGRPQQVEWDGVKRVGRLLDGDLRGGRRSDGHVRDVDGRACRSAQTRGNRRCGSSQRFPLKVWVSEPARLTLRFGTRSLVHEALAAGEARVPNAPRLGIVRAVAWDAAGNSSIPASKRYSGRWLYTRRVQPPRVRSRPIGQDLRPDPPLVHERLSDPILVKRAKDGDARALEALCERHAPRVERLAHHLLRDRRMRATRPRTRSRSCASSCPSSAASRRSRPGCTA